MKYYGREVIDDPMYHRFLKENIDVTKEDIRELKLLSMTIIPNNGNVRKTAERTT